METTDVIVVGAGAGGGVAAKVLACSGLKVVLLERGEWCRTDLLGEDDLAGQRMCRLAMGPGPGGTRTHPSQFHDNGRFGVVNPLNAACVGSGTVTYGAMAWRFMPDDFRLASKYGALADSSLADWPISYDDLEKEYSRAEWEIGVSGDANGNPFQGRRAKPYPMPPFGYNREAQLVADVAKKRGLHPFAVPSLRNSIPYNGRPACVHMRACVGFQCPVDAKCGTQNTVIPAAIASGNCDLRIRSIVTELVVNDQGKLTGVKYVDEEGLLHELRAKVVVVSASAISTARLLLLSRSKLFPNGAGNNTDQVGRNLQDHRYCGARGFLDEEIYSESGPGCSVAFCDFNHNNKGFVGGGVLHTDFVFTPAIFAQNRFDSSIPHWGKGHKEFMRKYYKRFIRICGPIQQIPRKECRCVLDDKRRDYWGMPLMRCEGMRHQNDVLAAKFLAERAREILADLGAKMISLEGNHDHPGTAWGGQHQAGTCRMGTDPKTSVTDKWGRVHDFPNLFIADGSLHVSNGGFNPVLTIYALAYRVSQHIVDEWNRM